MVNFSVPNLFFLQILYIFFEDLLLLGKRKRLYFSFTCVVSTTIYHTALKNHHMYILLQQLLNLIFNITTLLCWYISCLNQMCPYFYNNTFTKVFYEQIFTKTAQQETTKSLFLYVLLFMNNVHIMNNVYNTSRSDLNGLL